MTITVITGTPGAGKTLYAIEKLLLPLVGTSVDQTVDGQLVSHPRTIYTNIKGLTIDHELIGPGGEWSQLKDGEWKFAGQGQGLRDWHLWAKPGSVLVFDEVQQFWKPRANGSPVPPDIGGLETHRHMGLDFVIITQNVMLIDRNIQALIGRHLHVRRMANLALAIVYEWDHCSKALMYSKALTKSPWRYDKKVFKLYHSSDLHTKQPRSMPGLVWFIVVGLIAAAVLGPTMYNRMKTRFNPPPLVAPSKAVAPSLAVSSPLQPGQAPVNFGASAVASLPLNGAPSSLVVFSGCARLRSVCKCYDSAGGGVDKPADFCTETTTPGHVAKGVNELLDKVPDLKPKFTDTADSSLIAWANRDRRANQNPY